jgi:16S rRNA (guanine527-N7)-methyltransferase
LDRLNIIVAQVRKWQPRINLIAPSTLESLWERHIEDSMQLLPLAPANFRSWLDLGSGGGFPALVIAALCADHPEKRFVLVESNAKKCSFLRETGRLAGLRIEVKPMRIEAFAADHHEPFDVISARALAPLPLLLDLAAPFLHPDAVALFPKGQDVDAELAAARNAWNLDVDLIQSQTDADAKILRIRSAERSHERLSAQTPEASGS